MATSTIVWIGISLMAMGFLGMLIGYTMGHDEGRAEGFNIGCKHMERLYGKR